MTKTGQKLHFVGVAGTGMSALAQLRALEGHQVTGSDRQADHGALGETGRRLEAAGIRLFAQDGAGVAADTARVIMSTAIESDNRDLSRAAELKVPVVHRADELAAIASERRTIAVAGTSGKSTVTAMIFHILQKAGRDPSLVSGAALPSVRAKGLLGNAWLGKSDLLVIEADESDGTINRYKPHVGLLLNISKDHKTAEELFALFADFKAKSSEFVVSADAPGIDELRKTGFTYGFTAGEMRGEKLELSADASRFFIKDTEFRVPLPGRYNAENALAATAAASVLGVPVTECARGLADFAGVARRFELVGSAREVSVYDDYAHNPEKVRAALSAAHLKARRVLCVFQLHGFAPARFMKEEFIEAFSEALGPEDMLWLPDIYYAGGTAAKDISSKEYAERLAANGKRALHVSSKDEIPSQVAGAARPGDLVLVLGARDPSLPEFAASLLRALRSRR